jgi:hypothetical protein
MFSLVTITRQSTRSAWERGSFDRRLEMGRLQNGPSIKAIDRQLDQTIKTQARVLV